MSINGIDELSELSPLESLKWLDTKYGAKVKLSTAFGAEAQLLSYWISTHGLSTEIFTIDTGRLFQETLDLLEQTNARLNTKIKVYYPDTKSIQDLVTRKGPNSFYQSAANRLECCRIRKVEPLKRALSHATVWVTGIRADQSPSRGKMNLIEWNEEYNVIKFNPLLNWKEEQVSQLIEEYKIPINPLYRKGFKSIGCMPCTRAVMEGEDNRAGRWWWEKSNKECGLHMVKV